MGPRTPPGAEIGVGSEGVSRTGSEDEDAAGEEGDGASEGEGEGEEAAGGTAGGEKKKSKKHVVKVKKKESVFLGYCSNTSLKLMRELLETWGWRSVDKSAEARFVWMDPSHANKLDLMTSICKSQVCPTPPTPCPPAPCLPPPCPHHSCRPPPCPPPPLPVSPHPVPSPSLPPSHLLLLSFPCPPDKLADVFVHFIY